jgi:hypothetical protein
VSQNSNGALVTLSGLPASDFPRAHRMILQVVFTSSLAVPMARAGSVSTNSSILVGHAGHRDVVWTN